MSNNELLPCPFCGGHARPMKCKVGIEGTMGCNKWVTITCSMCEINNGGKGGFMRPRYDTEEEAAKAWNSRADASKMVVPDGYKLVPIEPTEEMIEDGRIVWHETRPLIATLMIDTYKAMNNEMPDEIWAGTYFDQETQNEWRERKMTGSEKYHHSRVVESLQKEIAELKEKLAKTEWQQIETAPKDGTEVILSKWSGSYATPETSFCWAINGYFKDGYWYSKDPIIGKLAEPTHWMPLPEPPTTEETK